VAALSPQETPQPELITVESAPETATGASIPPTAAEAAKTFGVDEDLFVTEKTVGEKKIYTIRVEAEETLGHFAEWLGLNRAQPLRTLNNLKSSRDLRIGQELRIPIHAEEEKKAFERQRIEYHQVLESEFQQHYNIVGEEEYQLKSGDSVWTISKDQEVPAWLLKRLNPTIFSAPPRAGDKIKVPVVEEKKNGEATILPSGDKSSVDPNQGP
jgi:membrane-bound lytic murein transglycosylase D